MVLIYNTNLSAGTTITLPFYGIVNVSVDWGDLTAAEPFTTAGNKEHIYNRKSDRLVKSKTRL